MSEQCKFVGIVRAVSPTTSGDIMSNRSHGNPFIPVITFSPTMFVAAVLAQLILPSIQGSAYLTLVLLPAVLVVPMALYTVLTCEGLIAAWNPTGTGKA